MGYRAWGITGTLLATPASFAMVANLLNALVGQPRPDYAILEHVPQDMGVPSGQATFPFLLGGVLIYLAWRHLEYPPLRWAVCAALALLLLAVGLSRVYWGRTDPATYWVDTYEERPRCLSSLP